MNQNDNPLRGELVSSSSAMQPSRILSRWQSAARAVWLPVTLFVFGLIAASVPILYTYLTTVCPNVECSYQLTAIQIQQLENLGLSVHTFAVYFSVILPLVPGIYLFVAFLLYLRKSAGWIGLLGAYTLVLFGGITFPETANLIIPEYPALLLPVLILDYVGIILFPLFVVAFPDGRINPRWSLILVAVWAILRMVSYWFQGSSFDFNSWAPWLRESIWLFLFGSLIYIQYYRYRRIYSPILRQQTKWVILGLLVALGGYTAVRTGYFLLPKESQEAVLVIIFANTVAYIVMALIPVSIALAIFRYRLWAIDLLINRTLVYFPLTGILGGLYAATVSLFQKIFIATTGQTSDAALILTTFVVASTFTPIRNGLQLAVDRRFKDSADPLKEISALDDQVRSVVEVLDVSQITRLLLDTSTKAFHASGGAIYIKQSGHMVLAHATPHWSDENRKLSLPLEWNGRRVGLLSLGTREGGIEYSTRDCQVLQQTANRVARVVAGFWEATR